MKTALFSLLFVFILSSCSTRKPPEIYAEGVAAEGANNMSLALERYEEVVRDFPTEALAESSLYRVVMIRTNVDADKRTVIDAQMQFLRLFPGSDRVPTMTFMMAFLYNNELHNTDSAKKYYGQFVDSWPEHELAPSARFELETLGKGPEELLGGGMPGGSDGTAKTGGGGAQ